MSVLDKPALLPSPMTRDEHIARAIALSGKLAAVAMDAAENHAVTLDALLNAYLRVAREYGQLLEAGECMLQTAGQVVINAAMERKNKGLDPFEPTPIVH